MKKLLFIKLVLCFLIISCKNDDNYSKNKSLTYNFKESNEGWTGDFADYLNLSNANEFYEFHFSRATLPSPLNTNKGALKQSGKNRSDDLFMFVKKKITALEPNKIYNVSIEVEFATNAPTNAIGVGGSPGEDVYIKAGASTVEPLKVLNTIYNEYRMNIDKGNQSQGGANMAVLGDFANNKSLSIYQLKTLATNSAIKVQSNANGELWIILGTDSGFEGTSTIYYNKIKVNIN